MVALERRRAWRRFTAAETPPTLPNSLDPLAERLCVLTLPELGSPIADRIGFMIEA